MLHLLRIHSRRLGRAFIGLFALTWLTVALQPCVTASEVELTPQAHDHHAMMGHHADPAPAKQPHPCAGDECPVFDAVEEQAAPNVAQASDLDLRPLPLLALLSWLLPLPPQNAPVAFARVADTPPTPPFPPVLEHRVLLI